MQITERDGQILRLVHRHRFLRSSHIASLLGSSQQILRRLQLLYHHGYLERPRAQLDYYHQGGSRHIIYGLGTKATELLRQDSAGGNHGIRWGEKNRAVGRLFLEHALLVSDFMVALELACRKVGNVRLLFNGEITGDKPVRWRVDINRDCTLGLIPDGVFALEITDDNGGKERAFFFLEADRGTMPVIRKDFSQTSFFRKLVAYEATWSQSIHRTHFGFHRFRVVTLTTSAGRVESLVEACCHLDRGHGLFLFADRSILDSSLITSFWKTGRAGEVDTLLGSFPFS